MTPPDLRIDSLGTCQFVSPLAADDSPGATVFVDDSHSILLDDVVVQGERIEDRPALELAGPRPRLFFDPALTTLGIVTCGGLCPGLNDVIRGIVMTAWHRYGVRRILGFPYGYRGCTPQCEPIALTPERVADIHEQGGTMLASSRGQQDVAVMAAHLASLGVDVLCVIGGDGTLRGAQALGEATRAAGHPIAVVGIPKTIDNDIEFIDQSFGFETAFSAAMHAIRCAHNEARGAPNGIGLVKLMGRHSGFIACHASLATSHVNFTLIPEVPFDLDGEHGLLAALKRRLDARQHAVIVVAEGAGQSLLKNAGAARDASGNIRLGDIGTFLADRINAHFAANGWEATLKYIDPSYIIRSVPANPADSVFCWRLATNAVHAGMCGKTQLVIGQWHGRFVHVPIAAAIARRKQVDPQGDLWRNVLESTGQPRLSQCTAH
ncbi:MAG: ATP-dependent 6-phosphofructokinase [Planctomycetaceae bacterium]|nr:ATP-dependent 6-phosphofructokinase [Planctomycetaceae bacterium]